MPEWAQNAFKGMKNLNRIQSRLYQTAFFGNQNILLSAPTGMISLKVFSLLPSFSLCIVPIQVLEKPTWQCFVFFTRLANL
jgi:hypothetical protein